MNIEEFKQLLLKPQEFVEKCNYFLQESGFNQDYDYDRFIEEELGELLVNYISKKSKNDRALLVDDICDSMWVCLAKLNKVGISSNFYVELSHLTSVYSKFERTEYKTIDFIIMYAMEDILGYQINQKNLNHIFLEKTITSLITISELENIDIMQAFKALCNENMSKLAFPISRSKEVFRDRKCNKKDEFGVLYPWYKPADFSKF